MKESRYSDSNLGSFYRGLIGRKRDRMIPLSTRMRPSKLEEFVGQTHFMFEG